MSLQGIPGDQGVAGPAGSKVSPIVHIFTVCVFASSSSRHYFQVVTCSIATKSTLDLESGSVEAPLNLVLSGESVSNVSLLQCITQRSVYKLCSVIADFLIC